MARIMVVWCPDWPVTAALAEQGLSHRLPAAVLATNAVVACNSAARDEGVRRGMRRRDAQARCPELLLLDGNDDRDARLFEPVLRAVEELRPGVAPLRPGLMALPAPGRFYGGEPRAAAIIAERLVELGVWDCRIGVADDLFTAEQAARVAAVQDSVVVAAGEAAEFLRVLPIEVLDDADLVGLLRRLGLHTLGDFTAVGIREVETRLGAQGARLHRLASGEGGVLLAKRTPPPELTCQVVFEPPLESSEAICFSVRQTVERFVDQLSDRGLVCTRVRIEAECDGGAPSSRTWAHPRWFTSVDLVDRVHWQLQGQAVTAPVDVVRFVPEDVELNGIHAEALWGQGIDEQVERGVARVQAMLGFEAVVMPVLQGGRAPSDRQAWVPWGERESVARPIELPWPGSLPAPAPARVFAEPRPAAVVDAGGQRVRVGDRGAVNAEPAWFRTGAQDWRRIDAWAGPWPVDELWWEDGGHPSLVARFQVVGTDGCAWLLRCDDAGWVAEASYD